jgi:LCP family protein required for cell wall assembly
MYADKFSESIKLISIPRDLYYKGSKINDTFRRFGPAVLAKELSEITGLKIKNYISIDMYAFVDAVNILGGLDIYLDEALEDPSYKVKNNGQWGTLYFDKGYHRLNGLEALRLARSRNTSSDFDRAGRQHAILASVKYKLSSLDAGDTGTIYKLLNTLMKYTKTDLTSLDALSLLLKYKNTPVKGQYVLSSYNVLKATYTNVWFLEKQGLFDTALYDDENFNKGAWILLPRNGDWSLLKKYIRTVISNNEAALNAYYSGVKKQ